MKTFALIAAGAVAMAATSAQADTFSGPSVGVQGGWVQNSVNDPLTAAGQNDLHARRNGGDVGAFVGYDYKLTPRVVVGAQAEFNLPIGGRVTDDVYAIQPKRSIDLSVRTGYLVNPQTLVYARGGFVYQRDRADIIPAQVSFNSNQNGWMVGAGVERAVTPNVTARLEYRYTDLSESDGTWDRHQVLAGVAYHF